MKYVIIIIIYLLSQVACEVKPDHLKVSKAKVSLTQTEYLKFKKQFQDSLIFFLISRVPPFEAMQDSPKLTLYVDTIYFSPDKDRVLFLTIVQYMDFSNENDNPKPESYFDSYCFLGIRKPGANWSLNWADLASRVRFKSYDKAKQSLQSFFVQSLIEIKDVNNNSLYKYNLDDKRFWGGPLWRRYFKLIE